MTVLSGSAKRNRAMLNFYLSYLVSLKIYLAPTQRGLGFLFLSESVRPKKELHYNFICRYPNPLSFSNESRSLFES